jgi:CDP-glycerol glycerophosphotransferase
LVLGRPTIFLDVEPPFAKGFSLDAGHRFGAIAGSMDQLLGLLERYLLDPAAYTREFAGKAAQVKARVYGDRADGHAAERCIARLSAVLARAGSSR